VTDAPVSFPSSAGSVPAQGRDEASAHAMPRTWLDEVLRAFADVRGGEGLTAVLLGVALFVGLFGYYLLKTVREPWVLATGGAELRSYATGIQAVVLMAFLPAYAAVARRVSRAHLVLGTSVFYLVCIEVFSVLAWLQVPFVGLIFHVWLGIYVLTTVAQLWSVANDLYGRDRGARLFPLVAIGAPLGSALGALAAARLFSGPSAIASLLQLASVLILMQLALLFWITRRPEAAVEPRERIEAKTSIHMVLTSPYLKWVALLFVVLNLVNTTGEYLLARAIVTEADQATRAAVASGIAAVDPDAFRSDFIRTTYGNFYFVVNVLSVVLQALLASRLVRAFGLRGALLMLPIVALGVYGMMAMGVGFWLLRALKVAENATDYSIENTARAILWLPTSRAEKYVGKQTVDTFFVRVGDVLSAMLVFGFAQAGDVLGERSGTVLSLINVGFAAAAIAVSVLIARKHAVLSAARVSDPPAPGTQQR
jgi:ATP:ADP antiporter, AAA family